jgi:rhodanese-related sulfurtransferase
MNHIRSEELKAKLERGERFQLIDVRSPDEFAEAHIPGAVNLPMEQVEVRLSDLHPHDPVVLVCQSGRRAGLTCEMLSQVRDDVIVLEGGTSAWREQGLPVIGSGKARLPIMRQVQLVVGPGVLVGSLLAAFVDPRWAFLPAFFGLGLTFAGATGWCGMGMLLAKAPWNRARRSAPGALDPVRN